MVKYVIKIPLSMIFLKTSEHIIYFYNFYTIIPMCAGNRNFRELIGILTNTCVSINLLGNLPQCKQIVTHWWCIYYIYCKCKTNKKYLKKRNHPDNLQYNTVLVYI